MKNISTSQVATVFGFLIQIAAFVYLWIELGPNIAAAIIAMIAGGRLVERFTKK